MSLLFLREIVIVLAASIAVIYVSHKIRLPSVVGFLLTGVIIGPGGLALARDLRTINVLAEVGVVMLLFNIGIEFSLERLKKIQKNFWVGGGLQVFATIAVTAAVLAALHLRTEEALFYGFLVSLSSTAVVLKLMADRNELDSAHGRVSLGILLFQDMAIVPMIAVIPLLAHVGSFSAAAVLTRFLLGAAAIATVFLAARFLMPRVLHMVVRTRIREIFLITALFLCLGMSLLTAGLGLSLALGAFLAGIIISESEYSHQVVSDILPFKDVFNSLFFISIGMLLDTAVVMRQWGLVLAVVLAVLLIKSLVASLTVRALGNAARVAMMVGLGLSQVGEFSFVLAGVGRLNGFLVGDAFQVFIAASVLTLLLTPFLFQRSASIADGISRRLKLERHIPEEHRPARLEGHVIIAGFGLNGRNLARVLKETGIPYIVLELNPDTVREARAAGEPVVFGDIASHNILKEAGVEKAKALVLAVSDPASSARAVKNARGLNPGLFIIVRTRYASEIEGLFELGANDVIPEEFETSLEIFVRVLEKYHVPRNIISLQVQLVRGECYGMLRGTCTAARPTMDRISDILAAGIVESYLVPQGAWFAGKTLGELDLRGRSGATVVTVIRDEKTFAAPGADFVLGVHDILVLMGDHQGIDRAVAILDGRDRDEAGGGAGGS
jgi:CPA2 family monovalent cation:H+ antiporter-2